MVLIHQGLSCLVAVRQWSRVDISSQNRQLNPKNPRGALPHLSFLTLNFQLQKEVVRVAAGSSSPQRNTFSLCHLPKSGVFEGAIPMVSKNSLKNHAVLSRCTRKRYPELNGILKFTKLPNISTEGRILKIATTSNCLRHHPSL